MQDTKRCEGSLSALMPIAKWMEPFGEVIVLFNSNYETFSKRQNDGDRKRFSNGDLGKDE